MKSSKTITWIVAVIVVILAGWYFFYSSRITPAVSPSDSAGLNGEMAAPVVKVSSNAALGSYLVAENGMTLYMYTKDTPNASNCTDACLANWPAYTVPTHGPFGASDGATGQTGTITRADGSIQVTYNGTPLYFWKNDAKPGDTTGQNVGGTWFVVKP